MQRSFLIMVVPLLILVFGVTSVFAQEYEVPEDQAPIIIPNEFIVTFKQPQGFISGELVFEDVEVQLQSLQIHTGTNQVFLVKTDENNLSVILSDSRVQAVEPNMLFHITGISNGMPFGVDRIEADLRANHGDGIDDALDVDIAVMDTGGNLSNPDMRIVNCLFFGVEATNCVDNNGHGSHVQGTACAIDNGGNGIVGVAEGCRIHSLKVCSGGCPVDGLILAADWVLAEKDPDGKQTIEVVNMSLGGFQPTTNTGCIGTITAWQKALCNIYEVGVIIVVACGNSNQDATNKFVPCAWDSTIGVSSMGESDGKSGGLGPPTSFGPDDRMSSFSNFGEVIDLIATGCDVLSYNQFGALWKICGTSMASPHVAGAAALATLDFLNPTNAAEVEQVRQFLINEGFPQDSPDGWDGDKDTFAEPLVQVAFGQAPPPPDDQDPPRSGIWRPRNADTVTETITVSFWAIDEKDSTPINTCFEVDGVVQECKNPSRNGIDTHFSWDTTGTTDGTHTLGGEVCDSVPNCVFVPTIDVIVTNLSLEDRVAQNTAHIDVHHQAHQTSIGTLGEDGGGQGLQLIIVVIIFGVTIIIIIRIGQRQTG